ncbi:hypothetical protein C5F47_00675 [Nitrosopumilus cobalaminigenes]|uniref:Polysaccharide biosynthesis protein n=1 Tax=Nitrosopumilus cobalaminigenes TaxID=1470066 RepID=A0A7D5R1E3_9ARCH|nr:hypothetical protein [Nitrosopumilus cobalaminigenes]QLH02199.1 hypothetical protein C5F47_00675 [Nitrosopumilus cobalaminigenes]
MSKWKKKIFDISSIGVADILSAGIAAIFWLYIAATIGPEDYGEITYLLSIAALASGLSLFGSNYTLMVYSAKKIELQSTLFLLTSIAGFVAAVSVFFFFADLGLSLIVLGYIILTLVISDLLGRKLYSTYSKYVILQKILMVIFGIGFYYIFEESGILLGISLSYFPLVIELIKRFKENKIDFKLLVEKKKFILNNFALNISGTAYSSIDKLIIAPLLGFAILGNYSLALQFFTLMSILPTVIQKYIVPQEATGNDNVKLKKIIILISVVIGVLGSTIGPLVISYIMPKFEIAEEIIRIVSWAIIPTTINSVFYYPKFWAKENNRHIVLSTTTTVLVQILGIITLGSMYGINGVAISFVVGISCGACYSFIAHRYLQGKN